MVTYTFTTYYVNNAEKLNERIACSCRVDTGAVSFRDDEVCKTFLLGCCPHEILSGTRADIGSCRKIHDLALKADYEMASQSKKYYYEFDSFDHLTRFVAETDQKIEISKKKLAEQQAEISAEVKAKEAKVQELTDQIGKLLAKAEQLGSEGEVDEAKNVLEEVEKVKDLKREAEDAYRNSMPASTYQQQKLRVCEVCSAYLGLHDNDTRLADHFAGKLHLGFIEIREQLQKLKTRVEEERGNIDEVKQRRIQEAREAEDRKKRYQDNRRSREDDRYGNSRDRRSPDRRRRRSRSRERRPRRSRSRSRERRRHHRRSRSPDRRYRRSRS
uniref:putative RNA-binding protein Luc7-like 1 isoform X1 n=1 Tax=Styela clava TaxID=7725 RepID=UPI00193A3C77|nr:putative RNA-binding protein Luc7-like 1 isoform X1 [Styela clava]